MCAICDLPQCQEKLELLQSEKPTMSPSVRLAPVVQRDLPTLDRVSAEAFHTDGFRFSILSHGPDLDLSIKHNTTHIQMANLNLATRFLKAIDHSTDGWASSRGHILKPAG